MLPPVVVVDPCTEALIWLFVSLIIPGAVTVMLPPLACVASVVTALLVLLKFCPALIRIFPASPRPVLCAEITDPPVSIMWLPADSVMLPPGWLPPVTVAEMVESASMMSVAEASAIDPPAPALASVVMLL